MVGHEKHKKPAAGATYKAPIGARETFIVAETSFVFFVAKRFGGSV